MSKLLMVQVTMYVPEHRPHHCV